MQVTASDNGGRKGIINAHNHSTRRASWGHLFAAYGRRNRNHRRMTQTALEQKQRHYGFGITPRLVMRHERFAHLTESAKWLYTCLKDICGENNGECFYSLRNLGKLIHISASTISRGIDKLIKAGLILTQKIGTKGREIFHIRIVDIWEENDAAYQDCFILKQLPATVSNWDSETASTVSKRNAP